MLMQRVWQRFIFYTPKNCNFSLSSPKNPYVFSLPKIKPTPTVNCAYIIVDLSWWKVQYPPPKKNPCFFVTQKNSCVFHRPIKIPFGQNFKPKRRDNFKKRIGNFQQEIALNSQNLEVNWSKFYLKYFPTWTLWTLSMFAKFPINQIQ